MGHPPLNKNTRARARIDSIIDTTDRSTENSEAKIPKTGNPAHDAIIAGVLKARAGDYTAAQLSEGRKWIHGYQAKMRGDDPHPPDDKILAYILAAVAPWTTKDRNGAEILVRELMADRLEPGDRYGWYVSVALQRVHGIQPDVWARARAQLRVLKKAEKVEPASDPEFSAEVLAAAVGGVKGMR